MLKKCQFAGKIAEKFMDNSLQNMMRDLGTSDSLEVKQNVLQVCTALVKADPASMVTLLKINLLSNLLLSSL